MTDLEDRFRAAAAACARTVVWHRRTSPADTLDALARAARELADEAWDTYGEGGPVEVLEREVADLLGKPAAAFFVSGGMAQQAALRVWCERRGSRRVALPDLAHQLAHEGDGPRILQGFRFEHLTSGRRTPRAADLRALPAGLGAVQIELPLREAGCLLPAWAELVELSTAARDLGVPLHVDGARLWESQPFYDRPLAEIAGLADTVYVSFYKGLGALAGAVVVGDAEVVDELRVWRRRLGGTIYRMTPYAVSALVGLRERLPLMGEYVAWARALAGELALRGLRTQPEPPQTNTFLLFAEGAADDLTLRLAEFMERERVQPLAAWRATETPGWSQTELTAHSAALEHAPAQVADWCAALVR